MIADIADGGAPAFQRYETLVLPLLPRHGGRLERRMRSQDGLIEVHIVSFETQSGYESYAADPERQSHRDALTGVDVLQRLLQVTDV
jgi:hypothetical protein